MLFNKTQVFRLNPSNPEEEFIKIAAEAIRSGGLVAFPTETVYGLGADALNAEAVKKIFDAKERPSDNPIIVHVSSKEQLCLLVEEIPALAWKLIEKFWPGPLTLIFQKAQAVPDVVTCNLDTVAVRMPDNEIAKRLIQESQTPIAAPSANISGSPSTTTGHHVVEDLDGKVDVILDAGPVKIGVESTVLDISTSPPVILRPGGLTMEALREVVGEVVLSAHHERLKRSPGTRYRHYSPRAKVILIPHQKLDLAQNCVDEYLSKFERIGYVGYKQIDKIVGKNIIRKRLSQSIKEYTRDYFATLREMDALNVPLILVEGVEEKGLGIAVMDRLRRAAMKVFE